MTTLSLAAPADRQAMRLPRVLALAWREVRAGGHGFGIFVACIALGVTVITGVAALGDAMRTSFERQGAALLGGDVTMARPHLRATDAERAFMAQQGAVGEQAGIRAMARSIDGSDQALVEIKGIDARYPLVGAVALSGGMSLAATIFDGSGGIAVEPVLLERLQLKVGDSLALGRTTHVIRATIDAEPDRLAQATSFGPRVLIDLSKLGDTGYIDPGSLVTWKYAIRLSNPAASAAGTSAAEAFKAFRKAAGDTLPQSGFTVRDRRDPSPQVSRTLDELRQFLTLLGLTALLVGGVGVANAVETYIDRRRGVIATLKSLGATEAVVFRLHLAQVLMFASLGTVIGLVAGSAVPWIVSTLAGDILPIRADLTFSPASLAVAAAYGLLVALVFTLWPLGRAAAIRPAVLFRDEVSSEGGRPPRRYLVATVLAVAALLALAIVGAESKRLAMEYCGAVAIALVLFAALGIGIGRLARSIPRPARPEIALALGDIGAPGGLTRSVVLSLGTGLSLLVAIALVDHSMVVELETRIPDISPSYFVLDISKGDLAGFTSLVKSIAPETQVRTAPMLRGRIVSLKGVPAEKFKPKPEHAWVLSGDRGLTYSDTVPEGSKLVEGDWWPSDYNGPPLVSFERDLARGLDLKIGDIVTVNVLGRNIEARIANLREVKWESLAINFVMIFTPNTLAAAPNKILATLTLPKDASLATDGAVARAIGKAYPAVTAIRVKDAIDQFTTIFMRIMNAIRAASSVTLLAGALVLAGALATAQRRRIKQAVILKTLGATRARILATHFVEYGLLGAATTVVATAVGTACAYITMTYVMKQHFTFGLGAVGEALLVALVLIGAFGGLGTWRVLAARPVPYLRAM